ncbi:MAG: glycosyltransferase, partial [Chloroflexota bacterium]
MKDHKCMKICFLAGTLGQGGAERQLFYQLQALINSGAQPVLICFSRGEYWQAPIEALGINVIVVEVRSRLFRLMKIISFLRAFRPEIVQAAHFYLNLYSLFGAWFCGARAIGAVRSSGVQDIMDVGNISGNASLLSMHYVAANSENAVRYIEGNYRNHPRLFYFPNVVDTDRFSFTNPDHGKKIKILMVGRFVQEKRFDLFLNALSKLSQAGRDNFEGHLVGDGPERIGMEKLAVNLGLAAETVYFHGSV